MKSKDKLASGIGIDVNDRPAIDPTANVISLVEAETKRQDDLRSANERFLAAELAHLKQVGDLRAEHSKEIRQSEADRLDKIRQVDVLAGATAAQAAATAIAALAATTDRNAENLRNQLTATAATIAKQTSDSAIATAAQTDSLVKGINDRLASLEKSSYQGAGKQSVSDPMLAEFVSEVRALVKSQSKNEGTSAGANWLWGVIVGVLGLLAGVGGVIMALRK